MGRIRDVLFGFGLLLLIWAFELFEYMKLRLRGHSATEAKSIIAAQYYYDED